MSSVAEKMYTVAAASLALAGMVAMTGCRSEVMNDRPYQPLDKTQVQDGQAPAPVEPMPEEEVKPAKKQPKYQPMKKAAAKPAAKGVKPAKATVPAGTYIVKKGDTMGRIAKRSGVKLSALLAANNMDMKSAGKIRIGQKIVIPGKNGAVKAAKPAAKGMKGAKSSKGVKAAKTAKAIPAGLLNPDGTYTVKRGDSIPRIARKLGVKASALQQANNLSDDATRRLQIGQKLVVPGKASAAAAAPAAKPAAAPAADADLNKLIDGAETAAPAAPATPAAAPAAAPAATPAAPAPAPETVGESDCITLDAPTTVEELAKSKNITVEQFLSLNIDLKPGQKLEKGRLVFLPKK